MYTLKNDGASTDPWGRPFFKRKKVLQDTLSADLVAEEYPKVSLANKAGDEYDCCSALDGF